MKKYALFIVGGMLLLFVLLGLASKEMTDSNSSKPEKEVLPNIYLSDFDSTQVELHDIEFEKGLVVGLINSECQICHSLVDELYKRAHKLEGIKIILISYQNIEDIKIFAENYPDPPFKFWKADFELLNTQFNEMNTPQVRLYNPQLEMIKRIDGIARVVYIKKYFEGTK
ncbi:hypothetical protein [Ekhidna sp.]|uniref:hypothetical protein n=1 Tax=Ekhidna sp. TaxID=2608089 RepID=UPI003B59F289